MAIILEHTVVPARDKVASAEFFARVFGLTCDEPMASFIPVQINETLTLNFDNAQGFETHHYAFRISDEEFDAILDRVKPEGIRYGSSPYDRGNMRINTRDGGRGFYFDDPHGHALEVLTR